MRQELSEAEWQQQFPDVILPAGLLFADVFAAAAMVEKWAD